MRFVPVGPYEWDPYQSGRTDETPLNQVGRMGPYQSGRMTFETQPDAPDG